MASLIYNSAIFDASTGAIDFDTDTFKMMLVTSSYTAAKTHMKRNAVTNEVSGTGYTAGGNAAAGGGDGGGGAAVAVVFADAAAVVGGTASIAS